MDTFRIYQKYNYANPRRLDHARDAWHLDGCGASQPGSWRRLDGEPRRPPPCPPPRPCATGPEPHGHRAVAHPGPAAAGPRSRAPAGPAARPAGKGGVPAAGRRLHCIGSPHTPAPLSPLRWTIIGGQNRVDIDGQGRGGQKCNGWHHRRVRRLIGFSTTWAGSRRRIGSGRAVGVRGGTLRGPGIWRSRRLVGGTSGWRGTCRRLRLGTVAPPSKVQKK